VSDHLTQIQIENYGRRQLSTVDLLPITDHLGVCDACRRQVQRALNGDAAYLALRSGLFGQIGHTLPAPAPEREHLTFEQIVGLVEATLSGEELQIANDHLSCCQECFLAFDDLRAFKDQVEPELHRRDHFSAPALKVPSEKHSLLQFWPKSLIFGSALAALLLVASGWVVWRALRVSDQSATQETTATKVAAPPTTAASPTLIAMLNDGASQVRLDTEGKLSGVEQLPPAYQQMVKKALSGQELERSTLLAGLTPTEGVPRGSGEEVRNRFSLIEPVRTVTLSEQPTFRWARLNGATGYIVEIYNEEFDPVASSPRLSQPRWKMAQALKRGAIYYWQVKAIKDGKEMISPHSPAPQVKFRVLDKTKASELWRARQAYGSSHLVLGLLYAEAGLLDEAEAEFRSLQKDNPDSAIAVQLLKRVRAQR
jgi:hypothetical protein